jgi:hypothetical protein
VLELVKARWGPCGMSGFAVLSALPPLLDGQEEEAGRYECAELASCWVGASACSGAGKSALLDVLFRRLLLLSRIKRRAAPSRVRAGLRVEQAGVAALISVIASGSIFALREA